MMKRRTFLKISGIAVAGQALGAASLVGSQAIPGSTPTAEAAAIPSISSSMRLRLPEAGTYLVSGQVRVLESQVQIGGIANAQKVSWAGISPSELPLLSFSSYETVTSANALSEIQVLGGRIESVTATPVDF